MWLYITTPEFQVKINFLLTAISFVRKVPILIKYFSIWKLSHLLDNLNKMVGLHDIEKMWRVTLRNNVMMRYKNALSLKNLFQLY